MKTCPNENIQNSSCLNLFQVRHNFAVLQKQIIRGLLVTLTQIPGHRWLSLFYAWVNVKMMIIHFWERMKPLPILVSCQIIQCLKNKGRALVPLLAVRDTLVITLQTLLPVLHIAPAFLTPKLYIKPSKCLEFPHICLLNINRPSSLPLLDHVIILAVLG